MYRKGPACSACPSGTRCSTTTSGLCAGNARFSQSAPGIGEIRENNVFPDHKVYSAHKVNPGNNVYHDHKASSEHEADTERDFYHNKINPKLKAGHRVNEMKRKAYTQTTTSATDEQ
jgi:hypothetical protein